MELAPGNGGMLLNVSEHGICLRAARRVHPKTEVNFAFSLDDKRRLEGRGRLAWADQDGRLAGLQFTEVSEEFRGELRHYLGDMVANGNFTPLDATGPASPPAPPASLRQKTSGDPAPANRSPRPAVLESQRMAAATPALSRSAPTQETPWAAMTPPPNDTSFQELEERSTAKLNDHASALLQHLQHEEARLIAEFREVAARAASDSEGKLLPLRESVVAQIKRLESAAAAAAVVAEQIGPLPARLERLQHQAIERFQLQTEHVLRMHVEELRRRSDLILAEANSGAGLAQEEPRRWGISTLFVALAALLVLAAVLFAFRRETAGAFISLGEKISGEQSASASPESQPEPLPERNATPQPNNASPETSPLTKETPQPRASQRDVKTLWASVAKNDVTAELTLGTMYLTGHGVTKNCYQALRLLTAAAKHGS